MNEIIKEIEQAQLKESVDKFNVVIQLRFMVRSRKVTAKEYRFSKVLY